MVADRAANPGSHRARICFFLGAGADISAGGLTFAQLKADALAEYSKRAVFDITLPETIETQFDNLFTSLAPDERALLVENLFRRIRPLQSSEAYRLLVLLAEAGGIDAVVTTNFDDMLEHAQTILQRNIFQVFAAGIARPYPVGATRFDLPKKPYLKLHGDIGSRSVTLLTEHEIAGATYDQSMLDTLKELLRTHDLVFAGYSGCDKALADIIASSVASSTNRIFWCSPHPPSQDAPLIKEIGHRLRVVRTGFDDLVRQIARPVLERPSLASASPTFLRCLLDWRIDYCNREYLGEYAYRNGKSFVDLFARRPRLEDDIGGFLRGSKSFALITGPSGYGKTTAGVRLLRSSAADSATRVLLIRSRALPPSGDIEQYVAEQLGGLGSHTPFSFFRLERWIAENDLRVVLFIDGLNEFSADLERCVQLAKTILRFCYFLPEQRSSLKIIATVRQETWQAMLRHLDPVQLRKTLWSPRTTEDAINTIPCMAFEEGELRDAAARLRNAGYAAIDFDAPGAMPRAEAADPYLFGMLADIVHGGGPATPSAGLYRHLYETRLRQRGSNIDLPTIMDALSAVALLCLSSGQDTFRHLDVEPAPLRGEIVRTLKDLHIFVDAEGGYLRFDHDRTQEYFLARAFATRSEPSLETIDGLSSFLRTFGGQSKAVAAARLHFRLISRERFVLITSCLRQLDAENAQNEADRNRLFGFARDVLLEMTEQRDPLALDYLSDAVQAMLRSRLGEQFIRTVIQCCAALPTPDAILHLTAAAHCTSQQGSVEASIFALDKLGRHFLRHYDDGADFCQTLPYRPFFADAKLRPWQRLGRLLGLAAQLGPDNTHPDEYAAFKDAMARSLETARQLSMGDSWNEPEILHHLLENCDRLMFNASVEGIQRFFRNDERNALLAILDVLAGGDVLCPDHWSVLQRYIETLEHDIEYHVCHALFCLSSLNDLDGTLSFTEQLLTACTATTSPVMIDFLHAVLVYLHVLHALPYDAVRFARYEERILTSWPQTLLFQPGESRGLRRGFSDPFDRVFEDGFGVIYPYGILLPSLRRRRQKFDVYSSESMNNPSSYLPLYRAALDRFLRDGRFDEALQMIHAIGSVIVLWPIEGLQVLQSAIGHPEARIRRGVLRILAESYNRHPNETVHFLRTSGAAVTDEEFLEIKSRQDARVGRRQVGEEEWARIAHYLLSRPGAKSTFLMCLRELLISTSPAVALSSILHTLQLSS
jgi:hypothetical protein